MKSRERRSEPAHQAAVAPASEGTIHPRRGLFEKIFHKLAKFFNGMHWAIGITTLPATATSRDERSFVLMWLGIIVFMIVFFAAFLYLLVTI